MTELEDYLYWIYEKQNIAHNHGDANESPLLYHDMTDELEAYLMRERYIIYHPKVRAYRKLLHNLSMPRDRD